VIQVEHEGDFWVEHVHILDRKVKVLRNKVINLLKVQWDFYGHEDTTWEHKETIREEYPQCFVNFEGNRISKYKTSFLGSKSSRIMS